MEDKYDVYSLIGRLVKYSPEELKANKNELWRINHDIKQYYKDNNLVLDQNFLSIKNLPKTCDPFKTIIIDEIQKKYPEFNDDHLQWPKSEYSCQLALISLLMAYYSTETRNDMEILEPKIYEHFKMRISDFRKKTFQGNSFEVFLFNLQKYICDHKYTQIDGKPVFANFIKIIKQDNK